MTSSTDTAVPNSPGSTVVWDWARTCCHVYFMETFSAALTCLKAHFSLLTVRIMSCFDLKIKTGGLFVAQQQVFKLVRMLTVFPTALLFSSEDKRENRAPAQLERTDLSSPSDRERRSRAREQKILNAAAKKAKRRDADWERQRSSAWETLLFRPKDLLDWPQKPKLVLGVWGRPRLPLPAGDPNDTDNRSSCSSCNQNSLEGAGFCTEGQTVSH